MTRRRVLLPPACCKRGLAVIPTWVRAYALIGQVALSETVVNAEGRVTVQVQTCGLWAYRFSTARLHQLAS